MSDDNRQSELKVKNPLGLIALLASLVLFVYGFMTSGDAYLIPAAILFASCVISLAIEKCGR